MPRIAPKWLAALALGWLLALPAQAAPKCPKPCVKFESIVRAAGVPHGLTQALEALEFDGTRLAASAQEAVAAIPRLMKDQPPKSVLAVSVRADDGLKPDQAKAQAAARAKALTAALAKAGVPTRQLTVGPAG